jgi:hypothetical protein
MRIVFVVSPVGGCVCSGQEHLDNINAVLKVNIAIWLKAVLAVKAADAPGAPMRTMRC